MALFGERPETPGERLLALSPQPQALYNAAVPAIGRCCCRLQPRRHGCDARLAQESFWLAVDRAFRSFWAAPNPAGAADRIQPILKTGVSFEEALQRVRHDDTTTPTSRAACSSATIAPSTASSTITRSSFPREARPLASVSGAFLPARRHRARPARSGQSHQNRGHLPSGVDEIRVFPNGWVRALWWSATQVDNLARILDRLKRFYNVDENRVYLTGTSDGGTGAYYMAFRDSTAWASFAPLIGHMVVLVDAGCAH